MHATHLPPPEAAAIEHSRHLQEKIITAIHSTDEQYIDFSRFMNMALYEPGLGYYSSDSRKFGPQGDFITAPEVSPLFAQSLANAVAPALQQMQQGLIIEFGAGSGILAVELLLSLEKKQQLPDAYLIVELSGRLQQRQQQLIQDKAPHLLERVRWLHQLPQQKVNAVVIANEVLDAMPVDRFFIQQGQVKKYCVRHNSQLELKLHLEPAHPQLFQAVKNIERELQQEFAEGYHSEINAHIQPWLRSLSDSLEQAAIFLIDYGYHRREYYSPERHMGTLMCYYRHRSHDNPLWYPGLQDITAFVDFSAVANGALATGFDVDGYTSQANFLLACGLGDLVEQQMSTDMQHQIQLSQQLKTLTLPSEMGERFKVMALSKNLQKNLGGFELRDFRDRL